MIPSWSEPRATSAIAEIRKFISKLSTDSKVTKQSSFYPILRAEKQASI